MNVSQQTSEAGLLLFPDRLGVLPMVMGEVSDGEKHELNFLFLKIYISALTTEPSCLPTRFWWFFCFVFLFFLPGFAHPWLMLNLHKSIRYKT